MYLWEVNIAKWKGGRQFFVVLRTNDLFKARQIVRHLAVTGSLYEEGPFALELLTQIAYIERD